MGGHPSGHLVPQYSDHIFTGKAHLMGTYTVDLQLLRQQLLAMQRLTIMSFLQLILQKLSWMNSRGSIHLTC
jgi:hypothetical protein